MLRNLEDSHAEESEEGETVRQPLVGKCIPEVRGQVRNKVWRSSAELHCYTCRSIL